MMEEACVSQERKRHRIEMVDTEIGLLGLIWQSPSTSDGERSLVLAYTADLLAERRELEAK